MTDSGSKPSQDDSLSPKEERKMRETLRDIFATGFPNPERSCCPDNTKLKALAWRRRFPEAQEIVSHLGCCSPCYQEHDRLVKQYKARRRFYRVAAIVILAAGADLWVSLGFWRAGTPHNVPPENPPIAKTLLPNGPSLPSPGVEPEDRQVAVLDIAKALSVTRGEDQQPRAEELILPRGRLSLTIYLPKGRLEGEYKIRLLNQKQEILIATQGVAEIRNHINVIRINLDSSGLPPGTYTLAFKRANLDWRSFKVKVK